MFPDTVESWNGPPEASPVPAPPLVHAIGLFDVQGEYCIPLYIVIVGADVYPVPPDPTVIEVMTPLDTVA